MVRTKNPFADPASSPELPYGDVEPGQQLGGRYQLVQPLTSTDDITLWEGWDDTLTRPVLMWIIPPHHRRTDVLLDAARASAAASDAHFLRVLDVLECGALEPVSCVITEYVPGVRLEEVLRSGPISDRTAAWLTAQLATALTPLHARDLFHQRLSPATVIVAESGDVCIAGFLLESALTCPLEYDGMQTPPSRGEQQRADLDALGQILYAGLGGAWPLLRSYERADLYGLPPAPHGADNLLIQPARLRPGISLDLDAICMQTLQPRPGSTSIRRAADLASVIRRVLGRYDGSEELAGRVRMLEQADTPPRPARPVAPTVAPEPAVAEAAPLVEATPEAATTPGSSTAAAGTDSQPLLFADTTAPTEQVQSGGESNVLPPRPHLTMQSHRLPVWLWLVALVVVVVLVLVTVKACSTPQPPAATPGPVNIVAAYAFDPVADGGNGQENSDQAGLAIDGDPTTAWTSEVYLNNPLLGGLKPGVGLVVDLGQARTVTQVSVTLGAAPVTVEARVPATDPTASSPAMDSQTQWTTVAGPTTAEASPATLVMTTPASTRWVLIYFTSLAPISDKHYQAIVDEIQVDAQG